MATTVGLISLGCSKNRVDSEQALGFLRERGYQIVSDPAKAEVRISAEEMFFHVSLR